MAHIAQHDEVWVIVADPVAEHGVWSQAEERTFETEAEAIKMLAYWEHHYATIDPGDNSLMDLSNVPTREGRAVTDG